MKIAKSTFLRYPVGQKFRRNRCISHGLGDMSTFAFFSIQNSQLLIYLINYSLTYETIPPKRVQCSDTLWVGNFDEIALSRTVKEIEPNLCFAILGKNSKIQNGRHFWGGENFF